MVVDVVTEFFREGALSELLYADDLVLMSDTIEGLRNKFLNARIHLKARSRKRTFEKPRCSSSAALQRMTCLKVKLTHVGSTN